MENVNNIKISVIVPVFNLEKEIERCISSICSQTHKNLEIIVVDDGSIDNSRDVITNLAAKDERIKTIFKTNGGVTSARLLGLKNITGDFIGFVDGDDEIEPDMYSRLLENALKYGADISHCGYQMVFSDHRVNYFYGTGEIMLQDNRKGLVDLLEGKIIEPGLCNKLFKSNLVRKALHDTDIDISIKINEDLLMNYYLFKHATASVFEDFCPYHYIVRLNSATRNIMNHHRIYDPMLVKKKIIEDSYVGIEEEAKIAYISTIVYTYYAMAVESKEVHKQDLKVFRDLLLKEVRFLRLLNARTKILAYGIVICPAIMQQTYNFYSKKFQKKKYI